MTTHENAPPPADWVPVIGNLCGGCTSSANLCRVVRDVEDQPCCGGCSHAATVGPSVPYYGD